MEGERLWNGLHGLDCEQPCTIKRMFGHSRMLSVDWSAPDKVHECVRQVTLSASRRLRRAELRATKLTVILLAERRQQRGNSKGNTSRWSREFSLPPARDDHSFLTCLDEAMALWKARPMFRPRAVNVVIDGLEPAKSAQGDLFEIDQLAG